MSRFLDDPHPGGAFRGVLFWLFFLGAAAGLIAFGLNRDRLSEVCVALVAAFFLLRVLLPYLSDFGGRLGASKSENADAVRALCEIPLSKGDRVVATAGADAPTAHRMAAAYFTSGPAGADAEMERFDARWMPCLEAIKDGAQEVPYGGLAGTGVGIATAFSRMAAGAPREALFDALATSGVTTAAGAVAFFAAGALARRAERKLAAHRADLVFVKNSLGGDAPAGPAAPTPLPSDNPFSFNPSVRKRIDAVPTQQPRRLLDAVG